MRTSGVGIRFLFMLLFLTLVGFSGSDKSLFAQSTYGSLTGEVSDPSGAAIPGATIVLTNVGTSFPQTETTDGTGVYLFKLIPPGNYMLTVAAHGFEKYLQQGIVIDANAASKESAGNGRSSATASIAVARCSGRSARIVAEGSTAVTLTSAGS